MPAQRREVSFVEIHNYNRWDIIPLPNLPPNKSLPQNKHLGNVVGRQVCYLGAREVELEQRAMKNLTVQLNIIIFLA